MTVLYVVNNEQIHFSVIMTHTAFASSSTNETAWDLHTQTAL
ncbi:hypothetical protein EVA_08230, partial [gut metagenome]